MKRKEEQGTFVKKEDELQDTREEEVEKIIRKRIKSRERRRIRCKRKRKRERERG